MDVREPMTAPISSTTQTAVPSFAKLASNADAHLSATPAEIVSGWVTAFGSAVSLNDISAILDLFIVDAYWRDMLALTWDFRAIRGAEKLREFLTKRLALNKVSKVQVSSTVTPSIIKPYPDIAWVQGSLTFDTAVGHSNAVVRLVPSATGEWKAFSIFTLLDGLKGFPETVRANRQLHPPRGGWLEQRRREVEFLDAEPPVVIVGAGHNGLCIAARLKYLGVPSLIVERSDRIGNQWRGRYASLCTHDPVWFTHLPYLPFPEGWPVYTPAPKLADWLESYAQHLELNVWTSSELQSASWDANQKIWTVVVRRGDGTKRSVKPRHVVYAAGWNGVPSIPTVPGKDDFKGTVIHSSQYYDAANFIGKKVIVLGSGVSGHDISQDLQVHGVDVTLYQRSDTYVISTVALRKMLEAGSYHEGGLPIDTADVLSHSFPSDIQKFMQIRNFARMAEFDKATLDGLRKAGFRLYNGPENAGFFHLVLGRRGGYYFDVGASQLIIDGKIKLKTGTDVVGFTPDGLKFGDGSELQAEVVIFATGFAAIKENIRPVFGDEFTSQLKDPWYLDEEGELRAVWRDSGHENFWYMIGNLSYARFFSKRLALQIKAIEEGIFGTRYSIDFTEEHP